MVIVDQEGNEVEEYCENCKPDTWLFSITVLNEYDEQTEEIYCNECVSNIIREDPTVILDITRINDSF